jgi:hypothetical protein
MLKASAYHIRRGLWNNSYFEMDIVKLYENAPLDLQGRQIRLVEIQPGQEPEIIQCKFHCFSLSQCPVYVALSYIWGPPKVYENILVDGVEFPVRRGLWWFLHFSRLRGESHLFWIDAICINQSVYKERTHQVRLMREIYSTASSVAVWLGEVEKTIGDSDLAMEFVNQKGLAPLRKKSNRYQPIWNSAQGRALLELCDRKYWRRIWIIQEIMHGREVTVLCGNKSFPWHHLTQVFRKLRTIEKEDHIFHHQHAAAVLASPAAVIVEAKSAWNGPLPLLSLLETYRDFQSMEIRDKVIGLLCLSIDSEQVSVDYSIPLISFFWNVLTMIWHSHHIKDSAEMLRVANGLKDTLKLYVSDRDVSSEISKTTESLVGVVPVAPRILSRELHVSDQEPSSEFSELQIQPIQMCQKLHKHQADQPEQVQSLKIGVEFINKVRTEAEAEDSDDEEDERLQNLFIQAFRGREEDAKAMLDDIKNKLRTEVEASFKAMTDDELQQIRLNIQNFRGRAGRT